ncbi:Crp/Fnr family transcriptional regulator [Rhodoferax sp. TBRC 17198]|uniref:Crp/Fnr family transcriptional regulator n=1 Tax=Rhodoferax potami TaxID=3068338 RepID=UPI0028BDF2B3|nr:Crp/Fnr family transcriptional regulator [Rhodoferax sp. TBRC 17198]MDT7523919.1 Crp/Fnr family transcriptional regulator [Rhodoferax sp. TBRC 17198]
MTHSKAELLKKMSVNTWFDGLPIAERKALLAVAIEQEVSPGEAVYRRGDASGGFYGVLSGVFRVTASGEDGREGILSVLEAGHWFGETSMVDGEIRPHDVVSLQAGTLLVITPRDFQGLMQRIGFVQGISVLLATRVRGLCGLVEDSMLRSTRTRVARRLISLARGDMTLSHQSRSGVQVSHEELAMMLGVTRQTLAKELKYLVGAGALALGYGHIEFRDTELLKREAALA